MKLAFFRHRHHTLLSKYLWLLLLALVAPALLPFYTEGLPRSFDGGLHLLRLGMLDFHIRHGDLYPRWVPELILGFGYPLFNFYAPSSYYLAEAFHVLGLTFYAAFIVSFSLLVLFAGLGMYSLARDVFGAQRPWAALVAATAYMYAPYLLTNVYIRGAIAEAAAQMLLPWILMVHAPPAAFQHAMAIFLPACCELGRASHYP